MDDAKHLAFNVCEARRASQRHFKANVLHHAVQAIILNLNYYIFTFYLISHIN